MNLEFSLIIPVYNRPEEIKELLESLTRQTYKDPYEIVIIEDGSVLPSKEVAQSFSSSLDISYYFKANSGPGDSRNYGMNKARGNYFIILDSDCILPEQYLDEINKALKLEYVDCFGGPDAAHTSFTNLQKAINYSMTSVLTTGGIRGNKVSVGKFQPRSFNMGLSKRAFEATGGFGSIHPGEDPDLTIRVWENGFETRLIDKAFVYHKRRISWRKFYTQVKKFGLTRPILNKWHPHTNKLTYWFPSLFILGLLGAIVLALAGVKLFLGIYAVYFTAIFIHSSLLNKSLYIGLLSVVAVIIQFFGYGSGFLLSTLFVNLLKKKPEIAFPNLFFNVGSERK